MSAAGPPPSGDQPSEATLRDFVAALGDVAAAIAQNTAELQAVQRDDDGYRRGRSRDGRDGRDRPASTAQRRTALDYRVLGALMGRPGGTNPTVNARRFRRNGSEQVELFALPGSADRVAVQAAGEDSPELLGFEKGRGADGIVTLDRTRDKDIARIEVQNGAGEPIRLGPRLARLPADGSVG